MTKALRSIFLLGFLATALAACSGGGSGGGDDSGGGNGGGAGGSGSNPPADVEVTGLAGTWFGTFDRSNGTPLSTFQLTVDGSDIKDVLLDGNATNLTGTIVKAPEKPRIFRFTLKDGNGTVISRGAWFVDPTGAYMLYLNDGFQTGALQKNGPTTLPAYASADLQKSWSGDTASTTAPLDPATGFGAFNQGSSTATCTSSTATESQCAISLAGGTNRAAAQLAIDDPKGRWIGSYTDTPSSGAPKNGTTRVYLSPDKAFAGSWSCVNFTPGPGGFPETCDFSAWKRQ